MTPDRSQRVDFFQLVSWLQRTHVGRAEVGHLGNRGLDVGPELLRFRPHLSLAFPARDIERMERVAGGPHEHETVRVELNFGGLYGTDSPLPSVFTEHLLHRGRTEEGEDIDIVRDFLDIFHHRIYSLTFRAWEKRRYHATWRTDGSDDISRILAALVGLGTRSLVELATDGGTLDRMRLLRLGALMTQRPRSSAVLRAALQDLLGRIPVRIEQFVARQIELAERDRTYLTSSYEGISLGKGLTAPQRRLGVDTVLGASTIQRRTTVRIHVGPLTLDEYEDLLPRAPMRTAIDGLMSCLAPPQLEYEVALTLAGREIPPLTLTAASDVRLGWTSWVRAERGRKQTVVFAQA